MPDLFSFDEDAFAAVYSQKCAVSDPHNPPRAAHGQPKNAFFDPQAIYDDTETDQDHKIATFSPENGPNSPHQSAYLHPLGNGPSRPIPRRRSSVYRRLSIKSATSVGSHNQDLVIPANYENVKQSAGYESPVSHHRVLLDFVPLKVLGQGAYGKVYLVQDKHTKLLFAQKQLRKPVINILDTDGHLKHVQRTLSEKQILTNITHHRNIVKLFYALQDADKFYLLLEYIPGGELFHHLTAASNTLGNVFKEDDVAFYAAEMALGLRHLHQLGIVYRDLKPENCLLNSEGHLVLTDFGLSKSIGTKNDDSCTSIIGTPEYMAPEILRGEEYDYAVDWWSLGCVIYDMMTGKPPFTGNSHKVIQDKIIKNKLLMPFYFTLDAKDLLNKLLNKNKNKRFAVDAKWDLFMKHRFFRKIDWRALERQDPIVVPPIVPVITDPVLAENFSEEFTGLRVSDYGRDKGETVPEMSFEGFSYTASHSFMDRFCRR